MGSGNRLKRLLVTGGCGFIGANFVRYLLENNPAIEITNLDALTYAGNLDNLAGIAADSRYQCVQGDISDRPLVTRLVVKGKFDAIVNFAAESHVDRSISDAIPFLRTNILGTQCLLDAAHCQRPALCASFDR